MLTRSNTYSFLISKISRMKILVVHEVVVTVSHDCDCEDTNFSNYREVKFKVRTVINHALGAALVVVLIN